MRPKTEWAIHSEPIWARGIIVSYFATMAHNEFLYKNNWASHCCIQIKRWLSTLYVNRGPISWASVHCEPSFCQQPLFVKMTAIWILRDASNWKKNSLLPLTCSYNGSLFSIGTKCKFLFKESWNSGKRLGCFPPSHDTIKYPKRCRNRLWKYAHTAFLKLWL